MTALELEPQTERTAFNAAMDANPGDDTVRLVYADWLEENGDRQAAAGLRWWVDARRVMRAGVAWDRPSPILAYVSLDANAIWPTWVRRLYVVEYTRIIREKYPPVTDRTDVAAVQNDCLAAVERYALLCATDDELRAAGAAARAECLSAHSRALASTLTASWQATWQATNLVASASESVGWLVRAASWSALRSVQPTTVNDDQLFNSVRHGTWSADDRTVWAAAESAAVSAAASALSALNSVPRLEE